MIRTIIKRDLVTVEPDSSVAEAARLMAERGIDTVLVLTNGKPRGLLTDRDIVVRCVAANVDVDDCTVENVMTETLETVGEGEGIFECIQRMHHSEVRHLPVVNATGDLVGMVSFGDLLALLSEEFHQLTEKSAVRTAA